MKILFTYIFIYLFCNIYSQQYDSLLYQLKQIPNDTERVNQIYKAGFEMRNTNPELAGQYALSCQEEAKKTNNLKHIAKSYNLTGILYYKKGNLTEALQFQKRALQLNESVHYDNGIAINQINLGNIYSDMSNYALAETSYLNALKAYNTIGNTLQLTKCLINLGVLKFSLKQYDAAVKQFQEALVIANQLHALDVTANCNNNIGAIFMVQGKLDSAVIYLEEGLKELELQDNEMEMADVYNNLANVYIKQNNIIKATDYLSRAKAICLKYDYTEARLELYHTYSLCYESQQNYKEANYWLKKHYMLKDSLQQITESSLPVNNVETATPVIESGKQVFKNEGILVILLVMIIGIPLFLIKFKR